MTAREASVKVYLIIFAALMVLLVLTISAAFVQLGPIMSVAVALSIAITKTVLIVLFFMHVKYRSQLIWIFAAVGFFWFLLLIGLTFMDYTTRKPWERGVMDSQNKMAVQTRALDDGSKDEGTE